VTLDNGTELFRVRARARRGDDPEPRPVFVTRHQDGTAHTYEPLSSGGDRRGLLRLAYTVPTELVGPATAFALELPDGHRIALPAPAPGPSRAQAENGRQRHDSGPLAADAGIKPVAETREQTTEPSTQLERELAELRSAHEAAGKELSSTREALATALSELDAARGSAQSAQAERDQAVQRTRTAQIEREQAVEHVRTAQSERDDALAAGESACNERDQALAQATTVRAEFEQRLDAARETHAEHDRLTGRLRQLQARNELLRADAGRAQPGADPRLRRLESEREQLATHVRALAELLSADGQPGEANAAPDPAGVVANGAADGLVTLRARAVRDANEQAERELRRLRATTPR